MLLWVPQSSRRSCITGKHQIVLTGSGWEFFRAVPRCALFPELTFIRHEKLHEQMPATPWDSGSLNELLGTSKEKNKEGKGALTFVPALQHTV